MSTQTKKSIITMTVADFVTSVFVDPERNIRAYYDVNPLVEQIFDAGEVWEAIEIYKATKDDGTEMAYVLGPDGNRRAVALRMLYEQDRHADIAPVPCLLLPAKPDAMGYLIRQLQSGNVEGKLALNAVEEGRGYARMRELDTSLTNAILAKRVGRSEQYVKGRQQLAEAPTELHDLCPVLGDKITETLARTYNKDSGDFSHANLLHICEQVKPEPGKPIADNAMEFCREVTGARGKAKKDAAVALVAKARPKKSKIFGIGQGPDENRAKTADTLPKTAKQTLAGLWNNYEAVIKELPADSPLAVAFKEAKVKTLKGKESVLRAWCEKTPEAKALTLYAGMPVLLQAFGIENKHPLTVARAIAQAMAKDDKDE